MTTIQRSTCLDIIGTLRDPKLSRNARLELLSFLERILIAARVSPNKTGRERGRISRVILQYARTHKEFTWRDLTNCGLTDNEARFGANTMVKAGYLIRSRPATGARSTYLPALYTLNPAAQTREAA
jgi:hypothetical protein